MQILAPDDVHHAVIPVDNDPNIYDPGGEIGQIESGGSFDLGGGFTPWGFDPVDIQQVIINGTRIEIFPETATSPALVLNPYEPGMNGAAPISSFTNCEGTPGENKINWDLIHAHEGGDKLEGYVPYDPKTGTYIGRSGVTIAAGFDIGQHNVQDMKNMGLDYALIEKLAWYTAPLIRQDAASALAIRPLTITAEEAFAIDKAAHSEALSRLAVAYDNAVGVGKFWTLNETLQTTLADMAFQMGIDREV